MGAPPTPRTRLQDIPIDALDVKGLMTQVGQYVEGGAPRTISYVNVHVLNCAARDASLRRFLQQLDLCYVDGSGVQLGARILGEQLPERMTGADWIHDLAREAAAQGWRIGWLGGEPGVTEQAAGALRAVHPELRIPYTMHGFFDREGPAHADLIREINAAELDILLVGMGTPIQEHWVARVREQLELPVVWCLGATADFISGRTSRGPAWLHERQEWLARLITEPGRLWRRYLIGNPRFLARMLRERARRSLP